MLLLFASRWRARPASPPGGVSTLLRTASRFFIRSPCAFCRSYTGSDEKTPRTRSGSQTLQAVKKVRNRQNQSTNKKRFTESEDWILRSVFSIKPTDSVIARRARAPDAAILNETICHPGTKYGRTERNRTLKERKRKRNEAANPLFCNRDSFLFRIPVLRHGMPYLRLKDCHGRLAASQ